MRERDAGTYENLGEVVGGRAVGVGGLYDSNVQLDSRFFDQFNDEPSDQSRNFVSVQKVERPIRIGVIKHDPIGISIETAIPLQRYEIGSRRSLLFRFHVIGTTLRVESA